MNSVLEYVRQLNQQSITLRNEWLDRLKHVECDPGTFSLSPEIALTKEPNLRNSDSANHEAPVTVVRSFDSGSLQAIATAGNDHRDRSAMEYPGESSNECVAVTEVSDEASSPPVGDSYSPMARLRELLGDELQVHGASYEAIRNVEPSASPANPQNLTIKRAIKPTPVARQSVVPRPHLSIRAGKPSQLHELRSPFNEFDQDETPVASVPFGDALSTETASIPGAHRGSGAATVRVPDLDDRLADVTDEQNEDRPRPLRARPATERPQGAANESHLDETLSLQPRSIDRITDQLLERFPVVASATIMFAALGPRMDVDNVAAKVATCLANRDVGGILLIDGNGRSRGLTSLMGDLHSAGFTELVNRSETLSSVVCSTENDNLEFLPFGNGDVTHRRLDASRATALGKEFNQAFQYTIITGGCIADSATRHWSGYVDAVYLLIDLQSADRRSTIDSLTALRQQAVRIAGIIAVEE